MVVVLGGVLGVAATPASPARGAAAPSAGDRTEPFWGLGTWLDVLDWSPTYTGGANGFTYPGGVDAMAAHGVQTVYIQTSRFNRPEDVLDPDLLAQIIARAHTKNMRVVGWYLPTLTDPATDLRRLVAASTLPFDAIGVDIESTAVTDIATRNANLVQLSQDLRAATTKPIAAIVLPPVVTDVLNPSYWPEFPWTTISTLYDAWMPMCYWSNRTPASGWNDGYRYTAENIDRVRAHLGDPTAPVHPIGGIANQVAPTAVADMVRAATERDAIGGSLYDYLTTGDDLWSSLQSFRDLPTAPGAPTDGVGVAGDAQATVTWTAPASNGGSPIDSYRITPFLAGVAQTSVVTPTAAPTYDVTGLVNGAAYTFAVEAHNAVGYGPASVQSSPTIPTSPSRFHTQPSQRVLDSRPGTQVGPFSTRWAPGETRVLPVAGHGGVPATGVTAVVMNITVTDTSAPGYLTAYPDLTTRPAQASNLNWAPGVTIANLATVQLGTDGAVKLYVNNSATNVIADVVGWYG
ncbi:MAG: fibronectin type III domain-containing protein [Acidimicrobiales bacterium]